MKVLIRGIVVLLIGVSSCDGGPSYDPNWTCQCIYESGHVGLTCVGCGNQEEMPFLGGCTFIQGMCFEGAALCPIGCCDVCR